VHAVILESLDLSWPDEGACEAFAQSLAAHVPERGATIELDGPLGAGKTTFTRHLLRALGVAGRIKSPSYAIVEPYETCGKQVFHFDFYRFADPAEWEDAGFREMFASDALKVVEWPDKAGPHLPQPDLRLKLDILDENTRQVRLQALTSAGAGWVRAVAERSCAALRT
jgi:tRNA threonylcarbamoyladenosine biosynthesis protein TsaE